MEFLLNRYRNLTVLLVAILAQLVLLAYQVKSNGEVRLIRVWAVTAVTPLARVIETGRSGISHFFSDYFVLLDVREDNKRIKTRSRPRSRWRISICGPSSTRRIGRASLAIFQSHSPSKTVAAHIIGNTTGSGAKVVIVDRGATSGVEKGMAVITPDGNRRQGEWTFIPVATFVLLVTDPSFAAGVISQKNRVHGTLKGQGGSKVIVDYVQNEENVEQGEWFYTSGDDRHFPEGLAGGRSDRGSSPANRSKEIYVTPSGFQNGLEEVLIVIEGVHTRRFRACLRRISRCTCSRRRRPSRRARAGEPAQTGPLSDADRIVDTVPQDRRGGKSRLRRARHRRTQLQHQPGPEASRSAQAAAQTAGAMTEFTQEFTEPRKKDRVSKFNAGAMIGIPLAAILFQVYVPQFIKYLGYLELPLLVTVYFALMRRSPIAGVLFGAGIGLAQDSLSHASLGDVRNREDAGGLLRRVGEPALRRGKSGGARWCWHFSSFSFTSFSTGCWRGHCWAKRWISTRSRRWCWRF